MRSPADRPYMCRPGNIRRVVATLVFLAGAAAVPSYPAGAASSPTGSAAGDAGSGPKPWVAVSESRRAPERLQFSDVGGQWSWAKTAIRYVAQKHSWMQDFGTETFKPGATETRILFARAVVKAFAPDEQPDPNITFDDLPNSDPNFDFANVAVKLGWMTAPNNHFSPDDAMNIVSMYRAFVKYLPLAQEEHALDGLQTVDGYVFQHPSSFATTELGMRLGLRYNHPNEGKDVDPTDDLPRAEVAYALWRTATLPPSAITALAPYSSIELPRLSDAMKQVVEWGTKYVGYPYIWGGEWDQKTPAGYCCGAQPTGGFDCSGLMWWSLKKPGDGYDNSNQRGYNGWKLPQRTAADMASSGKRVKWKRIRPGDLLFYDGDNNGVIDHVDLYLGRGWALDSSSGVGGVTILDVSHGWYRDHFVHGRHLAS